MPFNNITLKDKRFGIPISRYASAISENLAVCGLDDRKYYVFSIQTGKLFIQRGFSTFAEAQTAAEKADMVYSEYWPILITPGWEGANIPRLCRYGIPNGEAWDKFCNGE